MIEPNKIMPVKAVLFDFGGVVAEEGFRKGFEAIAAENGIDPVFLYTLAVEAVFESGYITGHKSDADFWQMIRKCSGIQGKSNEEYTEEILIKAELNILNHEKAFYFYNYPRYILEF